MWYKWGDQGPRKQGLPAGCWQSQSSGLGSRDTWVSVPALACPSKLLHLSEEGGGETRIFPRVVVSIHMQISRPQGLATASASFSISHSGWETQERKKMGEAEVSTSGAQLRLSSVKGASKSQAFVFRWGRPLHPPLCHALSPGNLPTSTRCDSQEVLLDAPTTAPSAITTPGGCPPAVPPANRQLTTYPTYSTSLLNTDPERGRVLKLLW